MPVERLGVVGAGTMGAGIAEVAILHQVPTVLYDIEEGIVAAVRSRITSSLGRQADRGRLTAAEGAAALARLALTTRWEDLAGCDLVIEAAPEDLALKREVFARLGAVVRPQAILASNTSSLSITALAAATARPERVVGMHFFNPAPVMALVEIIPGRRTAPAVIEAASAAARALGKTPVVAKDTPGFIVNRVVRPYGLEALRLLGEGVAPVETIDRIMRLAGGFRMGPFELLDLIGLDVNLAVTTSIYEAFFHEPRYRPHPIQRQMVDAGLLGQKRGRGFYAYGEAAGEPAAAEAQAEAATVPPPAEPAGRPSRVAVVGVGPLAGALAEASRAAGLEVTTSSDGHDVRQADLVVDVLLDADAKRRLIAGLRRGGTAKAVLLTLALGAAVTEIAASAHQPEQVVGFATLPPWERRRLVELLRGARTGPEAVAAARGYFTALGRETAVVGDGAGGVLPRILAALVNEAAFAVGDGVAGPAEIDTALRLGANYPGGLLEQADEIGLDILTVVLEGLSRSMDPGRYRPAPTLRLLVLAGWTGRAAGRGFYGGGQAQGVT